MKRRIAEALRSMADRLDPPPPPPKISAPPRFEMPLISPEVAARIGKRMADAMKGRPQLKVPVLPHPPPAPPAPRRLR